MHGKGKNGFVGVTNEFVRGTGNILITQADLKLYIGEVESPQAY